MAVVKDEKVEEKVEKTTTDAAQETTEPAEDKTGNAQASKKEEGVVNWYDPRKNFGFIGREGKDDVFVHANSLDGTILNEGDKVVFDIEQTPKGPSAINVEKV